MATTSPLSPVAHGIRLGFRLSVILAGVYAALGLLAQIGWQVWLTHNLRIWELPIAWYPGWLPIVFLLVLFPAAAIGAVTGGLIGELCLRLGTRLDGRVFTLVGMGLCAALAVGIHAVYGIHIDLSTPPVVLERTGWLGDNAGFLFSYPFLLGLPSLLYILAGAWVSHSLWQQFHT